MDRPGSSGSNHLSEALSAAYEVIPRELYDPELLLKPGEKLEVVVGNNRVEFIGI